jgi:dihydrofolate reductase
MEEQMKNPADLLLGRKTYEIFAAYWPTHEKEWPGVNDVTKYVASRTLKKLEWQNSVLLKGNLAYALKKLKSQKGPDLCVHGSSNMIQSLLKHDLVDELKLKIFPITLGNGKRLFGEGTIPAAFELIESKISPRGVIVASYKRTGKVTTGSF